jgi:hypothetical protein
MRTKDYLAGMVLLTRKFSVNAAEKYCRSKFAQMQRIWLVSLRLLDDAAQQAD